MKKYRFLLTVACACLIVPHGWAQIAISNTEALAFGKFVAGSGGSVTIDPNGVRTRSGGVLLLSSGGGAAATFNVSDVDPANIGKAYVITLPNDDAVMLVSGINSMALNNFVSNPAGIGTLTAGTQALTVGATLLVGANQPIGNYVGNFSVTVNYE